MNPEKIVIGLVGEKGGGKETVGDFIISLLPDKKVVRVRSSDILRETLTEWGLPLTRHNQQHLAIVMDQGFGLGTLSAAVKKRIATIDADVVLFDGIRWDTDVDLLRSFDKSFLIYVTAPAEMRYERVKLRKQKVGEESASYELFMEEEKVGTEVKIPEIGKGADAIAQNIGNQEDLKATVEQILIDIKRKSGI
jgi:dephospho-CoA kinase